MITVILALIAAFTAFPHAARGTDDDLRFEGYRRLATLGFEPVLTKVFADDSILAAIDALPPDRALRFDLDGDGAIDCLAYRDGGARVAALDGRGAYGVAVVRGDKSRDCFVVDADLDGTPERVVDYHDTDGDGRADREDLYEILPGTIRDGVYVLVYFDLDRDGKMLHLTNYGYHANRDEWESDFDGDTCFLAGRRSEATGVWTSCDENPFCFYDEDHDGHSDEAVRLEGENLAIRSVRWSFDADGDTPAKGAPDYDFSITAIGSVLAPAAVADSVVLRDGRALRFVSWGRAREIARWGLWRSALLVWDEADRNVAPQSEVPDRPRWEGVIADAYPPFPAVGGPGCGLENKRYELARDSSPGVRLGIYFSTVDDRIHLAGASSGEIDAVLPADHPIERTIRMRDGNGNGYFDSWSWTRKGAGDDRHAWPSPREGRTVTLKDEGVRPIPLEAAAIRRFWTAALPAARDRASWDGRQLERSIQWRQPTELKRWWIEAGDRNEPLAARATRSVEADRFLRDLMLWEMGGGFLARDPDQAKPGMSVGLPRSRGGAIEIPIASLSDAARKLLKPAALAELVGSGPRIPGQVEDDRLWFPSSPVGKTTLEIDPATPLATRSWVDTNPWFGRGIAFESERFAFRTYDGHIDLFAKRKPAFILRGDLGDYHRPQPWGIDPLDIGDGPGIGDLYIAGDGDTAWIPLFGSGRVVGERLVVDGPLRVRIETVLGVPRMGNRIRRTIAYGGHDDIVLEEIRLDAGAGPYVTLAAALPPLAESGGLADSAGIWSFGVSVPAAGAIGLAGIRLGAGGDTRRARVHGSPALSFRISPADTIRFAWIAGGEAYGDTTATGWVARATGLLARSARSPAVH